ncbi:MAG: hypothetical protein ABR981_04670 [Candidatus Micrarchaeaceae archaeon]
MEQNKLKRKAARMIHQNFARLLRLSVYPNGSEFPTITILLKPVDPIRGNTLLTFDEHGLHIDGYDMRDKHLSISLNGLAVLSTRIELSRMLRHESLKSNFEIDIPRVHERLQTLKKNILVDPDICRILGPYVYIKI